MPAPSYPLPDTDEGRSYAGANPFSRLPHIHALTRSTDVNS
jgi:hypothetical protein